uniref:Transposase n=1 Tax=Angiostrongylus cantonensis TaxID=6313 RepID=A0A0K0D752_ANGCA
MYEGTVSPTRPAHAGASDYGRPGRGRHRSGISPTLFVDFPSRVCPRTMLRELPGNAVFTPSTTATAPRNDTETEAAAYFKRVCLIISTRRNVAEKTAFRKL